MKLILCGLTTALLASCATVPTPEQLAQRQEKRLFTVWCDSMIDREYWLKIEVFRVHFLGGGKDVTNISPSGQVYYRGIIAGFSPTQTATAEDFARALAASNSNGQPRFIGKGSRVRITAVNSRMDDVKVDFTDEAGTWSSIFLKTTSANRTVEEISQLFHVAFAESEVELSGADATVEIQLGMTVEEVIKLKGKPSDQIVLGSKIILKYDDLKLIFQDGKLVEAE